jgi:hypothetical protein
MPKTRRVLAALLCAGLGLAEPAAAQGLSPAVSKPRPWSRISFFTNSSVMTGDDGTPTTFAELSTAFSYQLPEMDENGADYGLDVRFAGYAPGSRPNRVSVYEGFVGQRLGNGAVRFRMGHIWLTDMGSLGSLAGGVLEFRQRRTALTDPRWRAGVFGGLEPNILDVGYAPGVKKFGGYVAYDGAEARRHSVGYAMVRNGALTERSVVTTTNFLPVNRKVFVYQAAEFDVQPPAGMARNGLAYFFANGRVTPHTRVELQGTYNRGRSIDARGLGDDVLNGRPITQAAVDGLLFQSLGGRATVEVFPRIRVYAGYSRDKNNRDADPTGRTLIGGYASNVRGSGLDVSASDSLMHRPTGSYHSRYVSVGRQIGRRTYVSGDYSTSLSVIRFSRGDGITIETRPHTTRFSSTATMNITRAISLLATVERTNLDQGHEFRVLAGLTYRIR